MRITFPIETTAMPLLSQESRREEKRAFRLFDRNNDGVINTVELGVALRQVTIIDSF